jgi:putative acetyltransferase
MIVVRPQTPADLEQICAVNAAAFAAHSGTKSFDRFREERTDIISLVAETHGQIVGHVLFSPVTLATPEGPVTGMGLGQLAVDPAYQKRGFGTQLANSGLDQLRMQGCPFVIVVGHARYYPRFGFEPGINHNFVCQWESIPDDNFMVLFPNGERGSTLSGIASFDGM